jgi:glycosyltransferase involved in cell wall biosynthesis
MSPLVSIIITSYNYDKYLREAIESALNQSYRNVEVIVVDDGSIDSSPQIIRGYGDKIISVIKNNEGQSSAINTGFSKSKGEIVCLMDSDDVFCLDKIKKIVEVFEIFPQAFWCFHPLRNVSKMNTLLSIYPPPPDSYNKVIDFRGKALNAEHCAWGPATSGLCFRRALLEKILPLPVAAIHSPDNCIRNVALALEKGFFLNEPLSTMKIHGNNARFTCFPIITLSQAIWTREKFPEFKKIANKMFARSLSTYQIEKKHDEYYEKNALIYYSTLDSFYERLSIFLRVRLYIIKLLLVGLLKSSKKRTLVIDDRKISSDLA